jgi:MFS family permease
MGFLQLSAQITGALVARALGDVLQIYYFLAVANVVCAVITLATVREDPPPSPTDSLSFARAWLDPWKNSDFRWVWFTRFLNALGFYLVSTYLLYFLTDVVREFSLFGHTIANADGGDPDSLRSAARTAVFVIGLEISFVAAIGALVGGRLADRVGRKAVAAAAGVAMAVALLPVLFLPSFSTLAVLALPFAFAYGGYQSADWALASDVMPDSGSLAKNMGLWQSSIAAPQIVSGLAGMIVDWANGIRPGLGYQCTFFLAAMAFWTGSVLIKRIRGST